MKSDRYLSLPLFFSVFFLYSCNNEFSKYQKKDRNDLEKDHLVGNVKSVIRYYDGEITDIHSYNKYGFITEYLNYSDGEVVEKRTYNYNEFGKITREETKNKTRHYAEITKYDEYGYSIEESEETYEVFDTNSGMTVGKILQYMYENNYDKFGGLISRKCLRRDCSCQSEMKYNQAGNLSQTIEYSEDGSIYKYIDYTYSGNILSEEKRTYPQDHVMYSIFYYNPDGKIEKFARLYEDESLCDMKEYVFDDNGYPTKRIDTWIASSITAKLRGTELKPGDIYHTITLYDCDEHGSILQETKMTYYPNEDMSIPKEADETKTFQYEYDTHGNIIYEKDDEGHEYKYDISYY